MSNYNSSNTTVTDVIVAIGLLFLFPYIAMLIWNWQIAPNFGIATLTYWQSFFIGIMLKCWCPKPKTGH